MIDRFERGLGVNKRFGARKKNWEQRWCHAVTPIWAWLISCYRPVTRLFWKTTRPNNASCKNHPTLALTFAEMPMRIPVIVVYGIICHMCCVQIIWQHWHCVTWSKCKQLRLWKNYIFMLVTLKFSLENCVAFSSRLKMKMKMEMYMKHKFLQESSPWLLNFK